MADLANETETNQSLVTLDDLRAAQRQLKGVAVWAKGVSAPSSGIHAQTVPCGARIFGVQSSNS